MDDDYNSGYGSLGGEGIDSHDQVRTKIGNEGAECSLQCDKCGKPLSVVIPWAELIWMSQSLIPPNQSWYHNAHSGCFMPKLQCRCGDPVRLGVLPDECTRHLKSGIAAGKVNGQAVAGQVQQIQGQLAQQQRR